MIAELIMSIFLTSLMPLICPFASIRLYEINPENFKKIKIKKFAWMFRGIGGKDSIYGDVRNYGVIVPIFVVQILGCILAVIQLILIPILYTLVQIDYITIIVIGSMFGGYIFIYIAVTASCIGISKYRDKMNEKN